MIINQQNSRFLFWLFYCKRRNNSVQSVSTIIIIVGYVFGYVGDV